MPLAVVNLPNLTTTAGGTTSNAVALVDDAWGVQIDSPATLTSTAVFVETEATSTGTSFITLQSGGVDISFTAGKGTIISPITFKQIRVVTTAAEAAARTFRLTKVIMT